MWGATGWLIGLAVVRYISIHAPRVGSDRRLPGCARALWISIHAPRVGSDLLVTFPRFLVTRFQSTLPVWGATSLWHGCQYGIPDFNPRSPCGERRTTVNYLNADLAFQSTLPVWGATRDVVFIDTVSPDFNPRSPCGERHGQQKQTTYDQ